MHTIALNRWLYDESVGLEVDEAGFATPANSLVGLYTQLLDQVDESLRTFAVESWAESRRVALDNRAAAAMDQHVRADELSSSEGPLTWRNWKAFERETDDAARLAEGFERLVACSDAIVPVLEERLAQVRADFAAHGLTPIHTFCWREGLTPEALRAFLIESGQASRAPFQVALRALSDHVFGREAQAAELKALYLNRMYEPTADLFTQAAAESPASLEAVAVESALRAFRRIGFGLERVPVDLAPRPRKYPGAFCFPVAIPGDVRVSVRIASPHHLVDMLYHEFGHAAHFSGIRADLSFLDRYWIHSGAHETFSTMFEYLLAEPEFLSEHFGFGRQAIDRLLAFARFKRLLTRTWHVAGALTALDGWLENLSWAEIEARYAAHAHAFTGVTMPPGFARLHPFVNALSIYPAGYVLAEARVERWLAHLRALGGVGWWRSPQAQADIRAKIEAGGRVRFPAS